MLDKVTFGLICMWAALLLTAVLGLGFMETLMTNQQADVVCCTCVTIGNSAQRTQTDPNCPRHNIGQLLDNYGRAYHVAMLKSVPETIERANTARKALADAFEQR